MQYGLNLLLWTDRFHDGLEPVVDRIKAIGYDGVEIPIFERNEPLHRDWGRRLDAAGLARTAVTVRGAGDNPISPSAGVRAADAMRRTIDCCRAAGYDGWMVVEAFGLALPNIVAATRIWCRMFPTEDRLAVDALAFMKAQVGRRWPATP
jgi:sugar phosphate isomerase/epimerase